MLPALIGAIATIGSGILGASASSQAAEYNRQIELMNYYQRDQERMQAIAESRRREKNAKTESDRVEKDQRLGTTDAQGNRVHFVPGKGWVTELSQKQQELQDRYSREESQQFGDLDKKRKVLNDNVSRQGREGSIASGLLDAFQRIERTQTRDFENQLNNTSTRGITDGFDSALEDAMRAAIRTGSSNTGKIAGDIGKERSKMLEQAFRSNKMNAKSMAEEEYQSKRGNAANLYNMFATRASAMPDVNYSPRNLEGMTSQQLAGATGNANQSEAQMRSMIDNAAGGVAQAVSRQGGTYNPIQPDYGMANTVMSGGAALSEMFKSMSDPTAAAYAGVDRSMYKPGKGLW